MFRKRNCLDFSLRFHLALGSMAKTVLAVRVLSGRVGDPRGREGELARRRWNVGSPARVNADGVVGSIVLRPRKLTGVPTVFVALRWFSEGPGSWQSSATLAGLSVRKSTRKLANLEVFFWCLP